MTATIIQGILAMVSFVPSEVATSAPAAVISALSFAEDFAAKLSNFDQ
jgi:hypothetical protein